MLYIDILFYDPILILWCQIKSREEHALVKAEVLKEKDIKCLSKIFKLIELTKVTSIQPVYNYL